MALPLVSVVIPAYNHARFLLESVNSVLAQTYSPLEVIVIDDGSTDDTEAVAASFGHRITYRYQANRGLPAARNAGIAVASGEWIALLDSDDVWHPDKLTAQMNAICRIPDVGVAGSRSATALPGRLELNPPARPLLIRDFLLSSPLGTSGALISRKCFDEVGLFDETLTSVEDRDMWLRIAARFTCLQIESPCWWYRPHAGQMSKNVWRMHDNYAKVLTKFFTSHEQFRHLEHLGWSYLYFDTAMALRETGATREALNFLLRSFGKYPLSFRDRHLGVGFRASFLASLVKRRTKEILRTNRR